jgi:hypothetical protein
LNVHHPTETDHVAGSWMISYESGTVGAGLYCSVIISNYRPGCRSKKFSITLSIKPSIDLFAGRANAIACEFACYLAPVLAPNLTP